MFGDPGDLSEHVAFKLDLSGMGSISKIEVRKGGQEKLKWSMISEPLAIGDD